MAGYSGCSEGNAEAFLPDPREGDSLCEICDKGKARYTCPKCELSYCSLKCYGAPEHMECSDQFYRDCVLDEVEQEGTEGLSQDLLGKIKEMEKLEKEEWEKEMENEEGAQPDSEELDSDDDVPLEERLAGVDLDDTDIVWDKLSQEEQAEFKKLVENGEAGCLVPVWSPWWRKQIGRVEVVGMLNQRPKIRENIQELSAVTKTAPSDAVKYSMVNVLYAYACAMKVYNGDWQSSPSAVATHMSKVSATLSQQTNFKSFGDAIESGIQHMLVDCAEDGITPETAKSIQTDVSQIIAGPYKARSSDQYVLAALSEACDIFQAAVKEKNKHHFRTLKKLEYMLSWAKENYEKLWTTQTY